MSHLRSMAAALALTALTAVPVLSTAQAATLKWDFASPYPGNNYHNQNHQMFIDEIKARTKGAIDITLHAGASLYKLPQIRKAVQTGQNGTYEITGIDTNNTYSSSQCEIGRQ